MGDIVRCPACGQSNRIPELLPGKVARCGRCKQDLSSVEGAPVVVSDNNFDALIQRGGPVVVDFWAAWCGPCRTLAPIIDALAASRRDVVFAKLNVDESSSVASRFRVSGIPTLIFFNGGQERGRVVGGVGRPQIEQAMERYLGR